MTGVVVVMQILFGYDLAMGTYSYLGGGGGGGGETEAYFLRADKKGELKASYKEFVRLYKDKHRRDVPNGMEHWHSFAVAQRCSLHEGYMRIDEDLSRLRPNGANTEWKSGDISVAAVREAAKLEQTTTVKVKGGGKLNQRQVSMLN